MTSKRTATRWFSQTDRRGVSGGSNAGKMIAKLTSKGRVTLPKQIRDALDLQSGCVVQIAVNQEGDIVIRKVGARASHNPDRFDAARGKADIRWRTDDLMALLRA